MTDLLPCPFCGGEAETIRNGIGVFIGCFNEDCPIGPATSTYVDSYTEAEAIAAWNTRTDYYKQTAEYWRRMYGQTFAEYKRNGGNNPTERIHERCRHNDSVGVSCVRQGENNAPSSEFYAMECKLEVSRSERLGEAETVKTCNWSGFASLEVVRAMLDIMREVVVDD